MYVWTYTFTNVLFFLSLQVIGRANDVEYGLCASVWSENSGVTHRVAQAIDVSSQYTVVVVVF